MTSAAVRKKARGGRQMIFKLLSWGTNGKRDEKDAFRDVETEEQMPQGYNNQYLVSRRENILEQADGEKCVYPGPVRMQWSLAARNCMGF